MTVRQIQAMVLRADPNAKHYYSTRKGNFTVWQEYQRLPFAGNDIADKGWKFQIDRYTTEEYDPIAEAIEWVLNEEMVSYTYQVEYEEETGYIRHLFDCEGM